MPRKQRASGASSPGASVPATSTFRKFRRRIFGGLIFGTASFGGLQTQSIGGGPPTSLSYSMPANIYVDQAMSMSPTIQGRATLYTLDSGSLPTGLSLNSRTGKISGTPTVVGEAPSAVIRATGQGGVSVTATLNFPAVRAEKMHFGMNISFLLDSNHSIVFCDAMKRSFSWQIRESNGFTYQPFDDPANPGTGLEVPIHASGDARGYPDFSDVVLTTQNPGPRSVLSQFFSDMNGAIPEGAWRLEWDGIGTVGLEGAGNPVSSTSNSKDYYIAIGAAPSALQVVIAASNAGDPVRNIRIWTPTYADPNVAHTASDGTFRPDFLAKLLEMVPDGQTPIIRFLDWDNVNYVARRSTSQAHLVEATAWYADWDDRQLVSDVRYFEADSKRRSPVPYEIMVELCNELGADAWLNAPHKEGPGGVALDPAVYSNYLNSMSALIRTTLVGNCYLEYGNEIWNNGFRIHNWTKTESGATGGQTDPLFRTQVAADTKDVFDVWIADWGGTGRLRPVVMGYLNDSSYASDVLARIDQLSPGYVDSTVYATGCSGYFKPDSTEGYPSASDPDGDDGQGGPWPGISEIFADTSSAINGFTRAKLSQHRTIADTYSDVKLMLYECGQHILPTQWWATEAYAAQRDVGMYTLYREAIQMYEDEGVDAACFYFFCSKVNTTSGSWGHLENMHDAVGNPYGTGNSPKWDALVEGPN